MKIFTILLLLLLGGCQVNNGIKPDDAEPVTAADIEERDAKLKAFKPWRANGSIALESKSEGKYNASFSWDVNEQGFAIKLFGPLGAQVVELSETPEGAKLIDRSGEAGAANAEDLLFQALGIPVPIKKMQDWAVGLPGDATRVQRDKVGRLDSMKVAQGEMEWNIDYVRYKLFEDLDTPFDLPRVINIDGDGVTIKLSFKKWLQSEKPKNDRLTIPGVGV